MNKLKLNPDKTEFYIVVMSSAHHQQELQDLKVHINDVTITTSAICNLGIIFDLQLISMTCQICLLADSEPSFH